MRWVRSGPDRAARNLGDDLAIICTFDFRDLQAEITERSAEKLVGLAHRRRSTNLYSSRCFDCDGYHH